MKKHHRNQNRCYVAATAALMAGSTYAFVYPVGVTQKKSYRKRWLPLGEYSNNDNNSKLPLGVEDYEKQPLNTVTPPQAATSLDTVLLGGPVTSLSSADLLLPSTSLDSAGTVNSVLPATINNNPNDDISKEILLESISRTRPKDVLADVQGVLLSNNDSIKQDDASILSSMGLSSNATTSLFIEDASVDTPNFLEDVRAVLAFSEEAAAEAEASLSAELVEQLDISHSSVSNATSFAAAISTDLPAVTTVDKDVLEQDHVASPVLGEVASKSIEAPNVGKILKFAIPAIGVWLCGPLLSLIDTSAVGIFSGTVQQAALNPAVAVTDYTALLIAFMYTGTTNMVAAAQESDRGTVDKPRTAKTMIGAMQMSTFVGAGLGMILFAFARPLLKAIIGNDAISPAVFAAAMRYVRIRALGMPAAAIIGSTQAACLGMQDIRTPLYVLAAAAVVNFFGDVLFVGNSHPLIGGAAGAAWATVISQYVAVAYFIRWLCHKPEKKSSAPQVLNVSDAILKMTGKPGETVASSFTRYQSLNDVVESLKMTKHRRRLQDRWEQFGAERKEKRVGRVAMTSLLGKKKMAPTKLSSASTKTDNFSARGFLENRFSPKDLLKVPNKETRTEFAPYVMPVTTTQVGRVSGYVAMSHVVASSLGTVSMAAQQVIVSLFYCLCPIADSLSLTAQSFVPGIAEKEASTEKATALRNVLRSFLKAGAVFGVPMMAAVSTIPLLSGFFTSDPAVISLVNSVVPLLLVFFGTHGFVCASEGLLLGQKDLGFLGKMYAIFFCAVPFLMMRVKRAALSGSRAVDLTSVWNVFIGYQVFRCVVWLVRLGMLQRRNDRDAAKMVVNKDPIIAP
ncbi:MATE efflux family protein [Nitzschia inconspicua]|uniref:MATE efflux family protein n=1 Tax=Nitzschia inconspicua TaxID=303405 RepID=A0A9K3KUB7_9STRA|nr:MATE efflux family protein [Nitzschia inconspicua]